MDTELIRALHDVKKTERVKLLLSCRADPLISLIELSEARALLLYRSQFTPAYSFFLIKRTEFSLIRQ
jgi:hypothetical protein